MADSAALAPVAPAPAQAPAAASEAAPDAAPDAAPVSAPAPAPDSASGPSSDSGPEAGSQRLLFSHDLVSGRYRGSVHFGLVRLIHGEDSDSEGEEEGRGSSGCSEAGGAGHEEGRASPLRRGYVRVQWYPEGVKQHVKETKVRRAGGRRAVACRSPGPGGEGCAALSGTVPLQWAEVGGRASAQVRSRAKSLQQPCTPPPPHAKGLRSRRRVWCGPQGYVRGPTTVGDSSGSEARRHDTRAAAFCSPPGAPYCAVHPEGKAVSGRCQERW